MTKMMNRTTPASRLECAIENWQVLVPERRCAFNRLIFIDVFDNRLALLTIIAEAFECPWNGGVDDLEQPAANQPLVFDQRNVRFDPSGVAVHQEGNGTG